MFDFLYKILQIYSAIRIESISKSVTIAISLCHSSRYNGEVEGNAMLQGGSYVGRQASAESRAYENAFPGAAAAVVDALGRTDRRRMVVFQRRPQSVLPCERWRTQTGKRPHANPERASATNHGARQSHHAQRILGLRDRIHSRKRQRLEMAQIRGCAHP